MRRVLICGDREWTDTKVIRHFIVTLLPDTLVIHGGCRGADRIAGAIAVQQGLPVACMDAAWEAFEDRAGPIRNQWMLDYLNPTECHAFHDHIAQSKGTADMLGRAKKLGIPWFLHSHENP